MMCLCLILVCMLWLARCKTCGEAGCSEAATALWSVHHQGDCTTKSQVYSGIHFCQNHNLSAVRTTSQYSISMFSIFLLHFYDCFSITYRDLKNTTLSCIFRLIFRFRQFRVVCNKQTNKHASKRTDVLTGIVLL